VNFLLFLQALSGKKLCFMSTDETYFFPATLPRSVVGFVIGKGMSFISAFKREEFTVIRISSEFFFFTGTTGSRNLTNFL